MNPKFKKGSLDFKHFKKVSEDKGTATLMHPEGHKITIAKKALSPGMQNALSKLPIHAAEGTPEPVKDPTEGLSPMESQDPSSMSSPMPQQQAPVVVNVNNGQSAPQAPPPQNNQNNIVPSPPIWDRVAQWSKEHPYGTLGPSKLEQELLDRQNNAAPATPEPASLMGGQAQGMGMQDPGPAVQPQPAPNANPNMFPPQLMGGINEQIAGMKQMAGAQGEVSRRQAEIYGEEAQQQQNSAQEFQKSVQHFTNEYQNLVSDVQNNHIDPNHFAENRTVPQKVATAIGLILGGAASGITGQRNYALDFLNSQIDRDINAQHANQQNRSNLLTANTNMARTNTAQADMLRLMKIAGYEAQAKQAAAKMGTAEAQAKFQMFQGQLHQQAMPLVLGMSIKNQLENNPNSNPGQLLNLYRTVNPEAAKEFEARYIPNVGVAQIPLTPEVRTEIQNRKDFQTKLEDLQKWTKEHGGTLNPTDVNYGKTLAGATADAYRRTNKQGVFREAEKEFVDTMLDSDPSKFFAKVRTLPKLEALAKDSAGTLNQILGAYGIGQHGRGPTQNSQGYVPQTFKPSK